MEEKRKGPTQTMERAVHVVLASIPFLGTNCELAEKE